jgi:hypothetical protein
MVCRAASALSLAVVMAMLGAVMCVVLPASLVMLLCGASAHAIKVMQVVATLAALVVGRCATTPRQR